MTSDETSKVIPMHAEGHLEVHDLLPWYVTGRLDAEDLAKVETHLAACPDCQAEVRFQRRLDAEVVSLPLNVDQSWRQMRRQMGRESPRREGRIGAWLRGLEAALRPGFRNGAPGLGWGVAALAILVTAGTLMWPPQPVSQPGAYRTLSSGSANAEGNIIVMFRPDASEQAIRESLNAVNARLVDGPTSTDGYVLHVKPARQAEALASLRRQASVTLAQPLDAGQQP